MNEDLESGIEHMELCRPPDSSSRAVHFDADSVEDHQEIIIKARNASLGASTHIVDVHLGFLKVSRGHKAKIIPFIHCTKYILA